jgi:hypothetical protein
MSNDPANARFTQGDIPPEGIDTPHGRLYRPLAIGWQVVVLFAAFVGGPAFAWLTGQIPGDLSTNAKNMLFVPMVAIFFFGYSLWVTRLNAIAFSGIGWGLLKALFNIIILKRKPDSVADLMPSREKLVEMVVKAQRAGASFAPVGWLVGLIAGLAAMLFDSSMSAPKLFVVVAGACISWGYLLAVLGRRGWLPFPEDS